MIPRYDIHCKVSPSIRQKHYFYANPLHPRDNIIGNKPWSWSPPEQERRPHVRDVLNVASYWIATKLWI